MKFYPNFHVICLPAILCQGHNPLSTYDWKTKKFIATIILWTYVNRTKMDTRLNQHSRSRRDGLSKQPTFCVAAKVVSPRNAKMTSDNETTAEISYWWRVTTKIWASSSDWSCSEGNCSSTNQMHAPDPGSDTSSLWNFCVRSSDVIWRKTTLVASRNVGSFLRLHKE